MSLLELPDVRAFQRPDWMAFEAPAQTLDHYYEAVSAPASSAPASSPPAALHQRLCTSMP